MFLLETGYHLLKQFISLTLLVLPYFIFGAAFGALMQTYIKPEVAVKYLNKGTSSVINASVLGAILPGCSCATMPMADGLKAKGARLGTVAAFIMVSPLLSPHTLVLTYGMLGLKFTIARIIFSLSGAIILGILFNCFAEKKTRGFALPSGGGEDDCTPCSADCDVERPRFWRSFVQIIRNLGKYFILGMLIASVLTIFIPEEAIPQYIGASGIFAYAAAVLVGIPLYVCEGEEIPITFALLKLGLGGGPSLAFLLGSVGTCIPTMIMAQKIIGKRPTLFYIVGWFAFAVGSGLLFSLFS